MKFIKTSNDKKANGSSFHGIKIQSTLNELVKVFGKPSVLGSLDGKVTHEWIFTNKDTTITIYDYKEDDQDVLDNEIIKWHVGSKKVDNEVVWNFLDGKNLKLENKNE